MPLATSQLVSAPAFAPPLTTTPLLDLPQPLERLQVSDGLLITANHWQRAHYYHRQYQSLHYQALHESGIVKGLGVCLITAPPEISAEYRDMRWIQIQPGLAIDRLGHAIVVPTTMDFRVASDAPTVGTSIVYIVLRYVDPDQLQSSLGSQSEFVQETFRIDETTHQPDEDDIVLCRILLRPGTVALETTSNVFAPIANQLDLRDRKSVQFKPQCEVLAGTMIYPETADRNPWFELMRSLSTLNPAMQGKVKSLTHVMEQNHTFDLTQYDLLHLSQNQFETLAENRFESVRQALKSGTVLLIESSTQGSPIAKLGKLQWELQQAIVQANQNENNELILSALENELAAISENLNQQFQPIHQAVQSMMIQLGLPGLTDGSIDRHHPVRRQPFLFSQFPRMNDCPLYLWNWGNVILAIGDLSQSWDLDFTNPAFMISREDLRNAHEFGINILQFAASHHHLTQLQSLPRSISSHSS